MGGNQLSVVEGLKELVRFSVLKGVMWGAIGFLLMGCGNDKPSASADAGVSVEGGQVDEHPGEKIYQQYCFSCHTPGISGAPKLGDVEAWAPRIAKGPDLLMRSTIEGIPPAMPPRGLCAGCSQDELAQAIDYMVVESQ
jgi:cytochrome c5